MTDFLTYVLVTAGILLLAIGFSVAIIIWRFSCIFERVILYFEKNFNVWIPFNEIAESIDVPREQLAMVLRHLVERGHLEAEVDSVKLYQHILNSIVVKTLEDAEAEEAIRTVDPTEVSEFRRVRRGGKKRRFFLPRLLSPVPGLQPA